MTAVGLTGYGIDLPDERLTAAEIADRSGVPEDVVAEKMGVREKRVAGEDDHATDMCVRAAREALADADLDPADLDLVVYHGSEYKDHVVWSAAAAIAERLGADDAYATESYTLCAGAPIAWRGVRAQLRTGDVDRALLVAASREEDLVDYGNEDASFMFNFGSGACAAVLESLPAERADDAEQPTDAERPADAERSDDAERPADADRSPTGAPADPLAVVGESAAVTDGSFADDVVMPAGGSKRPPSHETVDRGLHTLDVPDPDGMKRRLGEVTLDNFLTVADDALARSGYGREDVDFVALVHMKRSFHETVVERLGLDPATDAHYLDEYGHVQSVDQLLAVDEGIERGLIGAGDVVLFLAAGTGYTWAATVLEWRGRT